VVRTGCNRASPFLRSVLPILTGVAFEKSKNTISYRPTVLDLGCGSGRNGKFLEEAGFEVLSFDRCPDHGHALDLSKEESLPVFTASVDVVLFQFVAMFLENDALFKTLHEIHRVAAPGCLAVMEVAAVKNCLTPTAAKARELCDCMSGIMSAFGWEIRRKSGMHFLASLPSLSDTPLKPSCA
jgi:SAM-dependent methyltransferase